MESHAFERRLTPCAEFPNDNQDLHHGTNWVCIELGREPACELPRPRPVVAAPERTLEPVEGTLDQGTSGTPTEAADEVIGLLTSAEPTPATDAADEIVSLLTICERAKDEEAPASSLSFPVSPVAPIAHASGSSSEDLADRLDAHASSDGLDMAPTSDELEADLLDEDAEPIEIVDDLSFDDVVESAGEPLPVDPFARLVESLAEVARGLGADDEGIACLDALFGQTRLEGVALGERAEEALASADVIARGARGITRSRTFTAKVLAWQGILRGETDDFALPDGGALEPLDEWAADLIARVVGPPARADGIRRDLRRRGIAAFGLVADAA